MRAMSALALLMALFIGRMVPPIDGMGDLRYGFLFENITTSGFALGMELCADHPAAHFQPEALCSNNTAKDGYISSNSVPQGPPGNPYGADFDTILFPYIPLPTCGSMVTRAQYDGPPLIENCSLYTFVI